MTHPRATTRRVRRLAMFTATTLAALTVGAVADAAPEDVPWYQRPVSVGTGFTPNTYPTHLMNALTSQSGRWIAFGEPGTSWDGAPPRGDRDIRVYLRDRWTDTTVRINTPGAMAWLNTMSPDGNLIVGTSGSTAGGPPFTTWFYRRDTGQMTAIPVPDHPPFGTPRAINNDGYYLTGPKPDAVYTGELSRIGRLNPDGTVTAPSVTAHGDVAFGSVTPSLGYAVGVRYREVSPGVSVDDPTVVNLATGETISYYGTVAQPAGDGMTLDKASFGISPSGRYVAMNWWGPQQKSVHLRLWDTQTATVHDVSVIAWYVADIRAVLDDGRVIARTADWRTQLFDVVAGTSTVIGTTFSGVDVAWSMPDFSENFAEVATDINRALICTAGPLSSFDTNGTDDCYLMPFPPSPLAPPLN